MSLSEEGFELANAKLNRINENVNKIFNDLGLELADKIQMNHYGKAYLFGKEVTEQTTNEELKNIIFETPKKEYNGHIDFFGKWIPE